MTAAEFVVGLYLGVIGVVVAHGVVAVARVVRRVDWMVGWMEDHE